MNKNKRKPTFTRKMEKRLLEMISKRPFLYNRADKSYFDKDLKDTTWNVIANRLGVTVLSMKRRWGYLREQYIKHLRAEVIGGPAYNEWKIKFPHYENMHFFKLVYRPLKKDIKMPWDDEEYEDSEDIYYKYYRDKLTTSVRNMHAPYKVDSPNVQNATTSSENHHEDYESKYLESVDKIEANQIVLKEDMITQFMKNIEFDLRQANFPHIKLLTLQIQIYNLMRQTIERRTIK